MSIKAKNILLLCPLVFGKPQETYTRKDLFYYFIEETGQSNTAFQSFMTFCQIYGILENRGRATYKFDNKKFILLVKSFYESNISDNRDWRYWGLGEWETKLEPLL